MEVEIFSSKGSFYAAIFRRYTRQWRFLCHLIFLRWRLWLAWVYPLKPIEVFKPPTDVWKGEIARGQELMQGEYPQDMGQGSFEGQFWQKLLQQPRNAQRRLYEFQWLRHLDAYENRSKSAELARRLIEEWRVERQTHTRVDRWISTRAERLALSLCYLNLLNFEASPSWKAKQQRDGYEAALQLADLMRRQKELTGFSTLKALLIAALSLPNMRFLLRPVCRNLHRAIKVRFLADGGHKSRNPELLRWDMAVLLEIRGIMKDRKLPIAPEFDEILQRGLDALSGFMHGDEKLACFNGSIEHPVSKLVNLWQIWRKPKPLAETILPQSGYVCVKLSDTSLIMDVSHRHRKNHSNHVGPLAFEYSRPGARLFVNCGDYRGNDTQWADIGFRTAAHSTLSFDHYDAWDTNDNSATPSGHCSIEEQENGINITADHYGYMDRLGYVHERNLKLFDHGKEMVGSERLRHVPRRKAYLDEPVENLTFRFHLHPSVSVEKMTPKMVKLKLKNGEYWEFSIEDENLAPVVTESIYLGETGLPQETMQLVIQAPAFDEEEDKLFHWKLQLADA